MQRLWFEKCPRNCPKMFNANNGENNNGTWNARCEYFSAVGRDGSMAIGKMFAGSKRLIWQSCRLLPSKTVWLIPMSVGSLVTGRAAGRWIKFANCLLSSLTSSSREWSKDISASSLAVDSNQGWKTKLVKFAQVYILSILTYQVWSSSQSLLTSSIWGTIWALAYKISMIRRIHSYCTSFGDR